MFRASIRTALSALAVTLGLGASVAQADDAVVVELFTSQGCSSCPPADKILHELAERDDVIALALHVDYWDYIGWKDAFANPAHSERQRNYARAQGRRSVYTPQMIVNGQDSIIGARAMELAKTIEAQRGRTTGVSVKVKRQGDRVEISALAERPRPGMVVHVLRYQPSREIRILRGENAGRDMVYANVVEDWRVVREWSGRKPLDVTAQAPGPAPVVVLIQEPGHGAILAAARLE